jgi:flagellar biosynthesis/type III secretory pathway protein FliH
MRVVHGLLALPRELEVAFRREVKKQEEAMHETMRSPYETVVWEEGREEGLQLGRQEGRQEGWRDGRQEGLEEGRCAAAREMLLGILTARFGPCDDATVQAIQALSDGSELMRLAQGAIHFGSLADFRHEVGTRRDVPTA